MRELYKIKEYTQFEKVRALVLEPGLTAMDIKKIEVRLQVTPQTILPYDWTAAALLIKDLRANKLDDQEIMRLMRMDKKSEIDDLVGRLDEADIYLTECLEDPENYAAVEGQEQQFIELQKAIKTKKPSEHDAARKIHFSITKYADDSERRVYDYRIAYGAKMVDVLEEFAKRAEIELPAAGATSNGNGDIFSGGAATEPVKRYEPVVQRISQYKKGDAKLIRDIADDIIEAEKGKNVADRPLRQLEQVRKILETVRVEQAADEIRDKMRTQLERIASAIRDIGTRLQR